MGIEEERNAIQDMLSLRDPADALIAYYALYHDARRTRLTVHRTESGQVDGFLAECVTGFDLFRPQVVLRALSEDTARHLLQVGLKAGRPYFFIVPLQIAPALKEMLEISQEAVARIYHLNPLDFQPIINVLVTQNEGADGWPRFEIRSQGKVAAASGINWRSPRFAEVYVLAEVEARGRGWARSVLSACTAHLLKEELIPLYMVEEDNSASIKLAESVGYQDTGRRCFTCSGMLRFDS